MKQLLAFFLTLALLGVFALSAPAQVSVGRAFNNVTGTFLYFGGTSASFPALKRNATGIDFRLADDSAYAAIAVKRIIVAGSGDFVNGSAPFVIATTPTISSGFGSSPSVVASNGSVAFTVNVGTGGVATGGVVAMPTATTGWNCNVANRTALAAARAAQSTTAGVTYQTATTTTTVTVTNINLGSGAAVAWAASDVLAFSCLGY